MRLAAASLGTALLTWLALVHAEVTVLSSVQTIYDRSPKLRIKATGINADEHDISLTMVRSATSLFLSSFAQFRIEFRHIS